MRGRDFIGRNVVAELPAISFEYHGRDFTSPVNCSGGMSSKKRSSDTTLATAGSPWLEFGHLASKPRSGETTIATGASPWMGISTISQPRAKRKLDRAQPQEKGRHRGCAAPF